MDLVAGPRSRRSKAAQRSVDPNGSAIEPVNLITPIFTDWKESIMSDTKSHPACEHHHLAAGRHVAAAYHHLQAVAQHDKSNHKEAKTPR